MLQRLPLGVLLAASALALRAADVDAAEAILLAREAIPVGALAAIAASAAAGAHLAHVHVRAAWKRRLESIRTPEVSPHDSGEVFRHSITAVRHSRCERWCE